MKQMIHHTGPVRTIDFNPFQPNLLASGGNDSEIFIWDLNNPDSPMSPGNKLHPLEDISGVAWNRQVSAFLYLATLLYLVAKWMTSCLFLGTTHNCVYFSQRKICLMGLEKKRANHSGNFYRQSIQFMLLLFLQAAYFLGLIPKFTFVFCNF